MKAKYSHKESKGLPGGPNEVFSYVTGVFSTDGYRSDSQDVNNPFNVIPSGNITMKERDGTPLRKGPLLGIDNLGNQQMMYPGMDYQFPGNEVTEWPMAQDGLEYEDLELTDEEIQELRKGGCVVEELPMAHYGGDLPEHYHPHMNDPSKKVYYSTQEEKFANEKQNWNNYLDHPFYQQNAQTAWGDDAALNIQKQKDRIDKLDIGYENDYFMDRFHGSRVMGVFHTPKEEGGRGKITIRKKPSAMGELHTIGHEIGHATDVSPVESAISTEYFPVQKQMYPEFSGYYPENLSLNSGYTKYYDPNNKGDPQYKEYLELPTEFRTRLNHVKGLMIDDNFNWNEKSGEEISEWLENKISNNDYFGLNGMMLGHSALQEVDQISKYNYIHPIKYSDFMGDDYKNYADKDWRKAKAKGKDGNKVYKKAWKKGIRTPEQWWDRFKAKYWDDPEEKKQFLEDKDGDGEPDLQLQKSLDTYGPEQDPKFLEHVFKKLAQEQSTPNEGQLPMAQTGEETEPNMVHRDANWAAKVRAEGSNKDGKVKVRMPSGEIVEMDPNSEEYAKMQHLLYNTTNQSNDLNLFNDIPGPHLGKELDEFQIITKPTQADKYPYWDQLTAEEKQELLHPSERVDLGTHARYVRDKATYGYGLKSKPDWNVYDALVVPSILNEGLQMGFRTLQVPQALAVEANEWYDGDSYDFSNVNPFTDSNKSKMRRPSDIMEGGKIFNEETGQWETTWSGLGADIVFDPLNIFGLGLFGKGAKAANLGFKTITKPRLYSGLADIAGHEIQKGIKGFTNKLKSQIGKKGYTNAKFFDDFERNVSNAFNKGDKATWYDDVATTGVTGERQLALSASPYKKPYSTPDLYGTSSHIPGKDIQLQHGTNALNFGIDDIAYTEPYMSNTGHISRPKGGMRKKHEVNIGVRDPDYMPAGFYNTPMNTDDFVFQPMSTNAKQGIKSTLPKNAKILNVPGTNSISTGDLKYYRSLGYDAIRGTDITGSVEILPLHKGALKDLRTYDVSKVAPPANSKSSGKFNWEKQILSDKTTADYIRNISEPNMQVTTHKDVKKLVTDLGIKPEKKIVERWPKDTPVSQQNVAAQEKAFKEGKDIAENWAITDPKKYKEIDALQTAEKEKVLDYEKFYKSKMKDLDPDGSLGKDYDKEVEAVSNKVLKTYLDANGLDNVIDLFRNPEHMAKAESLTEMAVNNFNSKNPQYDKLRQLREEAEHALDKWDAAKASFEKMKEELIDPTFKEKVRKLYEKSGEDMPEFANMPDIDKRNKLVRVGDEADPSFANLSDYDQDYLREYWKKIGGVRTNESTITLAEKPGASNTYVTYPDRELLTKIIEPPPVKLTKPSTWKNARIKPTEQYYLSDTDWSQAKIYDVVEKKMTAPARVKKVQAHEVGHDMQESYGHWSKLLEEYSPEFGYNTGTDKTIIAKAYNDAMVDPQLPGTTTNVGGFDYETWKSSVSELHSELMASRVQLISEWMSDGYSAEEAIKHLKTLEAQGNDATFAYYLENGTLNKHFKESVPFDVRKALIQGLPVTVGIFGTAAAMASEQKELGGEYEEMELTPFEITELRARGHRVDIM